MNGKTVCVFAPAVNPAILAASAAGGKKGCDDRAAIKADCKR
jgi:hypothetical protein